METKIYRPSAVYAIVGVPALIGGLVATGIPLMHLITGNPWMIQNSKHSVETHAASTVELLGFAGLYAIAPLAGAFFCFAAFTMSVTLDLDGMIVRSGAGVKFMERYEDLISLQLFMEGRSRVCRVQSRTGAVVRITNMYTSLDQIADELRSRAPQLAVEST